MTLAAAALDRLRTEAEIVIETRRAPDLPARRTVIWVVVDPDGRVLVRTYLGPRTRWFRDLAASPDCAVEVGSTRLAMRAIPVTDPRRIAAASAGYRAKYAGHRAAPAMVAEHNLSSTLELVPR